ncbi:MAG: hypothetical protein ACFB21_15075 [Opitutales bacterium]
MHGFDKRDALRALRRRGRKRTGLVATRFTDQRVNFALSGGYLTATQLLEDTPLIPIWWADRVVESERRGSFLRWVEDQRLDSVITVEPETTAWLRLSHAEILESGSVIAADWTPEWKIPGLDHQRDLV